MKKDSSAWLWEHHAIPNLQNLFKKLQIQDLSVDKENMKKEKKMKYEVGVFESNLPVETTNPFLLKYNG